MKALAYIYILTTWVFVPIANYQPEERTEQRTESQPEILFWCDCGAKYRWTELPMKKLN
jgi:hypothetical protein